MLRTVPPEDPMPDRAPRLGDVIDDYCPTLPTAPEPRRDEPLRRRGGQGHLPDLPQHARLPARPGPGQAQHAKKDDKKSLMEQVLASMPKPPEPPPPPPPAPRHRQEAGPLGRGRADPVAEEGHEVEGGRRHPEEARRRRAQRATRSTSSSAATRRARSPTTRPPPSRWPSSSAGRRARRRSPSPSR